MRPNDRVSPGSYLLHLFTDNTRSRSAAHFEGNYEHFVSSLKLPSSPPTVAGKQPAVSQAPAAKMYNFYHHRPVIKLIRALFNKLT